jgi:hypothetical protein
VRYTFRVLLDSNVLVDAQVRGLFLRLAENDHLQVCWTDLILEELHRTLTGKLGQPPEKVDRL